MHWAFNRSSQGVQFDWPASTGPELWREFSIGEGRGAGPCIERVSIHRVLGQLRVPSGLVSRSDRFLSGSTVDAQSRPWCSRSLPRCQGRAVRRTRREAFAVVAIRTMFRMPGHHCSLVPGQRAAKLRWRCRDRPKAMASWGEALQPHDHNHAQADHASRAGRCRGRHSVPKMQQHCCLDAPRQCVPPECRSPICPGRPMIRSPSQCPGTARSAARADRSLITDLRQ